MPVATSHPIVPATYSETAPDPSTLSPGLVKRARRTAARAKAIIETKGWTQRTAMDIEGKVCLGEAIGQARMVKSKKGLAPLTSGKVGFAIAGILEEARPKVTRRAPSFYGLTSVVSWNDKPGRSKQQVLALLDKAASG